MGYHTDYTDAEEWDEYAKQRWSWMPWWLRFIVYIVSAPKEVNGAELPGSATKIDKPWGHEIVFAHTPQYVGKILFVKSGHKLSLQYHKEKDETIFVKAGRITLEIHTDNCIMSMKMKPGDNYHIIPGTIHRIIAEKDSEVLEASTSQLDDVVRLQDDYGRQELHSKNSMPKMP